MKTSTQKGFIVPLIGGIVALLIAGGVYWAWHGNKGPVASGEQNNIIAQNDEMTSLTNEEVVATSTTTSKTNCNNCGCSNDCGGGYAGISGGGYNGSTALVNSTSTQVQNNSSSQPSITVLSPNGGEKFKLGDTINIRWTASNAKNIALSVDTPDGILATYGTSGMIIDVLAPNTGNYSWTIPSDFQPGFYKIDATVPYDPSTGFSAVDRSDSVFTITN
jgi:hypothetical protein